MGDEIEIKIELPEDIFNELSDLMEFDDEEIKLYNADYEETWLDDAVLVKHETLHKYDADKDKFISREVWVCLLDNVITKNRTIFNDIHSFDESRLDACLETRGIV